ncbi:MAG: cell division protein FtsL [Rhodobacteraceae bacterium]|nr:cell division protein FtsL [Paracoccaceae bacterium]
MRSFLYVFSAVFVMTLAYWAYHENYRTKSAMGEVAALQRDIGQMREELAMLNAEWAYLNRPDRLRALVEINFDRLGLMPLRPEQFGRVDQIAYPGMTTNMEISDAVDVVATQDATLGADQ